MIIPVIYATFAVVKRKLEKNSGLYGIPGQGFESRTSLNFFSCFLFATAKVAQITAMIILHLKTMELVILNHIYFLAI